MARYVYTMYILCPLFHNCITFGDSIDVCDACNAKNNSMKYVATIYIKKDYSIPLIVNHLT